MRALCRACLETLRQTGENVLKPVLGMCREVWRAEAAYFLLDNGALRV